MKVAWFTPTVGASGIVEFSRHVVRALAERCDVDVWTTGAIDAFPEAAGVVTYSATHADLQPLSSYDAVFYNLGNHVRYHAEIFAASRLHPGIVVLHDYSLHHFFAGYWISERRAPEHYRARMSELYGARGMEIADAVLAGREDDSWAYPAEVLEQPFIEESLAGALGAVVHSHWHGSAVGAAWPGPVCELWLPTYDEALEAAPAPAAEHDRTVLMTIGHVERNKHVHRVVEAIVADPELARASRYVVAGGIDGRGAYARELAEVITRHSMAGVVRLLGYAPDDALARHAAGADVFVNLRSPNLEGGSASLMYQLPLGRPVVVYDSGGFAELPDDAVVKIDPNDPRDLSRRLRELVADPALRARIGAAGRQFAEQHTVGRYADALLAFAGEAGYWVPRFDVVDRAGAELAAFGADPELPGVAVVDRELLRLFGAGPRSPVA